MMAKQKKLQIGRTVRELRTKRGLTTTVLAKKVGISQAQVSRLENDEQGFRSGTLVKIASALGVKPWFLFMTEDEQAKAGKMATA
jgi:transcriptional regulator with XRE-family HTH domain